MRDGFELLAERERKLRDDETLEDGADHLEETNVDDLMNIRLHHVAHHVRVLHHLSHLVKFNLLIQVALLLVNEPVLALLHTILGQVVGKAADALRSLHTSAKLDVGFHLFEAGDKK